MQVLKLAKSNQLNIKARKMKKLVFEDLEIYKAARKYRKKLSKLSKALPKKEQDRLGYDLIDSSRAITTILAKGNESSLDENIYCCETAVSYAAETLDMMIIAFDEGYINDKTYRKCRKWNARLVERISNYQLFLRKQRSLLR